MNEQQAEQLMKEGKIHNYVVEDGKVIVKQTMDEHVGESSWGDQEK
jgi:hypothetical protein